MELEREKIMSEIKEIFKKKNKGTHFKSWCDWFGICGVTFSS